MTRWIQTLFFTALLFVPFQLPAQAVQYEDLIIETIDFVMIVPGGKRIQAPQLCSRIKSREGDLFSQVAFDNDLKVLSQEFAEVTPHLDPHGDSLTVRIEVVAKPIIRSIRFRGNREYNQQVLLDQLEIRSGTIYDPLVFSKAFRKLQGYYVTEGFFEAELDYTIERDPECDEVDIWIDINEGRCGKIKRIVFHNFTECEREAIVERMVTKEWSFLFSWFTEEGVFNEDAVEHDRYTILDYLQNEGYADADVIMETVQSSTKNRIEIHIIAEKGDLYTLGDLTFEGNEIFTDEAIRSKFTVCEGGAYSPEAIRETITAILNLYGRNGYIDAFVDFEPKLVDDQPVYSVHFTIEEGQQYRVGLIKIFGNISTQNEVILHETLLIPGELFDLEKLKATEIRLHNIGFFCNVNVYAVKAEDECGLGPGYRDVHIEVEETGTGSFSAFGGFSNVENVFGGIQITEKNFNWRGLFNLGSRGLSGLRGGGEYAYIRLMGGTKSRTYSLSWTKPYFNDTQWIFGFDVQYSNVQYVSDQYETNSYGLNVHGKYPINAYMNYGLYYRVQNTHTKLDGSTKSEQLKREADNNGFVSAVGTNLTYDSTDSYQKPSCGFRSRFELELAGVGGVNRWVGLGYLNSYYYPFSEKNILKLRWDFRFIQPFGGTTYDSMPIDERLFIGGDDGIRGYRAYSIGPKFVKENNVSTDDPRGGLSLGLYSAEIVHRFNCNYEIFAFADAGDLSRGEWRPGWSKSSVGVGARLGIIPGGPPLMIGYGWPLGHNNDSDVKRFFFNIGGTF